MRIRNFKTRFTALKNSTENATSCSSIWKTVSSAARGGLLHHRKVKSYAIKRHHSIWSVIKRLCLRRRENAKKSDTKGRKHRGKIRILWLKKNPQICHSRGYTSRWLTGFDTRSDEASYRLCRERLAIRKWENGICNWKREEKDEGRGGAGWGRNALTGLMHEVT